MPITGQALDQAIGTPTMAFTMNAGTGAGVQQAFGVTMYGPDAPEASASGQTFTPADLTP